MESKEKKSLKIVQIGVENATAHLRGVQFGFLNYQKPDSEPKPKEKIGNKIITGIQLGLVNVSETTYGVEIGLVNESYEFKGLQLGALNMSCKWMKGWQLGIINGSVDSNHDGIQTGLANFVSKEFNGVQIGLFCYANKEGNYGQFGFLTIRQGDGPWYSKISPFFGYHKKKPN